MADLLVIVPTRGRPQSVAPLIEAWNETAAWVDAQLAFVVDQDDPSLDQYKSEFAAVDLPPRGDRGPARLAVFDSWRPLVPKLNAAARLWKADHFALGFAGDDHLPRTAGWTTATLAALREMGTGVVYGDDLYQRENLCTSWAMTSDIVRALGRMVPASVEHMYCDNAVMDVAKLAGCLRYLPDVVIEHMHPLAGKADWDDGYKTVNRAEQFRRDETAYRHWLREGRAVDVEAVRALRAVKA